LEYFLPFAYGIGTGFLMSVLLGVIFFMLIQTGLNHDYKKAYLIAAGVITGDILFIFFAIKFTENIKHFLLEYENYVGLAGGLLLIGLGLYNIFKKSHELKEIPKSKLHHARDFYLKAFLFNLLNPANAAWWLGLYGTSPALEYALTQKIIFGLGAIATVFWTEIAVAYFAGRLKRYTTPRSLKKLDLGVGLLFTGIGLRLIWVFYL
jgi:threonine/homoserine/homoserine lactone efflux protein